MVSGWRNFSDQSGLKADIQNLYYYRGYHWCARAFPSMDGATTAQVILGCTRKQVENEPEGKTQYPVFLHWFLLHAPAFISCLEFPVWWFEAHKLWFLASHIAFGHGIYHSNGMQTRTHAVIVPHGLFLRGNDSRSTVCPDVGISRAFPTLSNGCFCLVHTLQSTSISNWFLFYYFLMGHFGFYIFFHAILTKILTGNISCFCT